MSNITATTTIATAKKITKREKFEMLKAIAEVQANPILSEFIERELELLAKKNSAEKKPTAQQEENEAIKETILENLTYRMTISEMQKTIPDLAEYSNQKISALMRQLILEGLVEKVEDKRKSYFSKV